MGDDVEPRGCRSAGPSTAGVPTLRLIAIAWPHNRRRRRARASSRHNDCLATPHLVGLKIRRRGSVRRWASTPRLPFARRPRGPRAVGLRRGQLFLDAARATAWSTTAPENHHLCGRAHHHRHHRKKHPKVTRSLIADLTGSTTARCSPATQPCLYNRARCALDP